MHGMLLLWGLSLSVLPASNADHALTFEEIVARPLADPEVLSRRAALARFESDLAATGGFAREGASVDAELGPRRIENGTLKGEVSARIEVPLLAGHERRSQADERLHATSGGILAAEAVASRLRLKGAYLAAWFEQERLLLSGSSVATLEELLQAVRERVTAGADAPYEMALVEGDLLRSRTESDAARELFGAAWAELAALAGLPPEPLPLASPGTPDLGALAGSQPRLEGSLLLRAAADRRALEAAFVELEQAKRRSRWSLQGSLGKEGLESFVTAGAGYRFRRKGEREAIERERASAVAALDGDASADVARLRTRFETASTRLERFGPIVDPRSFDAALHAVARRIELGKDRPSEALPVRRQLLEAQEAALQRIRDAHLLIAEIEALTAQEAP